MLEIREARESDIPELEKLFLIVRQKTFEWEDPKNFTIGDYKKSTDGEKVFVAVKDESIVGFISIYESEGSFIHIHNLFIYPDFQNQGIGKNLLRKVLEVVPKPVTMKVVTHNTKACTIYERLGWKKISTHEEAVPPYHLYLYDGIDDSEQIK